MTDKITHLTSGLPIPGPSHRMIRTTCVHLINDRFVRVQGDVDHVAAEIKKSL